MKQFQVMIKDKTGIRALVNGSVIDGTYFVANDICTKTAGYDTLGAAKRMATIATKQAAAAHAKTLTPDALKTMIDTNQYPDFGITAVSTEDLIAEAKAFETSYTKTLMAKYYPEQEKAIREASGDPTPVNADPDPTLKTKPVKVAKVRKPRVKAEPKVKDPMFITDLQRFFLDNMRKDDFYEHGMDSCLWVPILADTLNSLGMAPMTTGAMVSTLREKGMLNVCKDRCDGKVMKFIALTDLGKQVMVREGFDK